MQPASSLHTQTLIVGAGPGGLACARLLAEAGHQVLVAERNPSIGPKVCAGGITWSGLIRMVPGELIERSFPAQVIRTACQRIVVRETNPIVATVNRTDLGQWMAEQAEAAGARIMTGARVVEIGRGRAKLVTGTRSLEIRFQTLVGADGTASLVRRFLALPVNRAGMGINVQLPGRRRDMEWHLNPRFFGPGYGWIFPHRNTVSIGAFVDRAGLTASRLKTGFLAWARQQGFEPLSAPIRAALVGSDYQGFAFDNVFLVGDAAGLASGLTGEGIYPAMISGQAAARRILDPDYPALEIQRMVKRQKRHHTVVRLAARNGLLSRLLMEWLVFLLKIKVLDFHALEMAD